MIVKTMLGAASLSRLECCSIRPPPTSLAPFLLSHHPDPLQWKGQADFFRQLVVVSKQLFQQLLTAPEPHSEEVPRQFLLHIGLEATPAHEQAGLGPELLASADQLVHRGEIHRIRA